MQRRNTTNKKQILSLFEKNHTMTAQSICELLSDLDVSTVYRNLERFVADGVLRKVYVGADATTYEFAGNSHNHFVCNGCGGIEEIDISTKLNDILPEGAQIVEGGITIRGLCKKCNYSK